MEGVSSNVKQRSNNEEVNFIRNYFTFSYFVLTVLFWFILLIICSGQLSTITLLDPPYTLLYTISNLTNVYF